MSSRRHPGHGHHSHDRRREAAESRRPEPVPHEIREERPPSGAALIAEEAAAVAHGAAVVAQSAASVASGVTGDDSAARRSSIVQQAAAVVEEAAAVVEEAAHVLHDSAAAPAAAPMVERRRRPRRSHLREAVVGWKHLAIYAPVLLVVFVVGALAIWSFLEKQSLQVAPLPLPPVTVLTSNPQSRLVAAWVRFLGAAEMPVTVVSTDHFEPLRKGVVVLCDAPDLAPEIVDAIAKFHAAGGAVAIAGAPPTTPLPGLPAAADGGLCDATMKLSESGSPILARTNPGAEIAMRRVGVPFLRESPRMTVDARWASNSRAAIVHMGGDGAARTLWLGFDPDALAGDDRQLLLVVRTAFRWLGGQPVSEGAVGQAAISNPLTPAARRAARAAGFAFSVDPLRSGRAFSITMANRGPRTIEHPTVKLWLPPDAGSVVLGGDLLMRRSAALTDLPDEHACLISLPALGRREERVMKLKIVR